MPKGEMFMGLLDAGAEEPKSKALRYVISGVVLALLIAGAIWFLLRYTTEKHTATRFMNAVVAGDTQQAYQIWHPHAGFSYQDFLSFWGPSGYYSPIKSYRIETAEVPPKGGTGVVVVIELSEYDTFPKAEETIKSARNREVQLWIERSDQSMSFPPP
jgi:hypothetical protein